MMNKQVLTSLIVAALCFMTVHSYGQTVVNLDFESISNGGSPTSYTGQGAVADPGNDFWNQVQLPTDVPAGHLVSGPAASGACKFTNGHTVCTRCLEANGCCS